MKEWLNEIPAYEDLKKLDKSKEYVFNVFDICGSGYLRFTYNEDFLGKISIDYMEGGFLHNLGLPIRHKTKIIENIFYNTNKKNYNDILKFIKLVKEAILLNLNGHFE